MAYLITIRELKKRDPEGTQSTILSAVPTEKNLADRVDTYPIKPYIYNMKGRNMQKTINKYQSKFDRLMQSIEKDKTLKKMPGNATAGIAVQMIKNLKNYLRGNKA